MARCKNIGGGPGGSSSGPPRGDGGDRGDSPPRITEVAHGKRKLLTRKKRSREEREAAEALVVAQAAEPAESSGRGSGILIDRSRTRVPLEGCVLGTEATEEAEDQPTETKEQEQ